MKRRPTKPPKYCQGFVDRNGHARWYFRRPGFKRVPLPGLPWSPGFMEAYDLAMQGGEPAVSPSEKRIKPGSVDAVAVAYYRSYEYGQLKPITKQTYRNMIERFRAEHGDKPIARIERGHITAMMAKRQDQPQAANGILRIVRILMRQALEMGLRTDNPTLGLKRMRSKSSGYLAWSEEHIAEFQAHHQVGTRAHLALALLVNTGQRRSDVVRMGWQHCRAGWMSITQQKTGALVEIPIHPDLQAAISALPRSNMTFLVTGYGQAVLASGVHQLVPRLRGRGRIAGRSFAAWAAQGGVPPAGRGRVHVAADHGDQRPQDTAGSGALHTFCQSQGSGAVCHERVDVRPKRIRPRTESVNPDAQG